MDNLGDEFTGDEDENQVEEEDRETMLARLQPLLFQACLRDEGERILELIDEGADLLAEDHRQWNALCWAACHGNEEIVRYLMSHGACAVYFDEEHNMRQKKHTPLHWACFKGHLNLVWLFIGEGFSVQARDALGNTPLHQAASGGHLDVVKCLLGQGVDAFAKNERGHRAFECTSDRGSQVQALLRRVMEASKCQQTGKKFVDNVAIRYLCAQTNAICCEEGIEKLVVFADRDSEKKEKCVAYAKTEVQKKTNCETALQAALDEYKTSGDNLDTVRKALEEGTGVPVDCKVESEVKNLGRKLEAEIALKNAMEETTEARKPDEIPDEHRLMALADALNTRIENGRCLNGDEELLVSCGNMRRRLLVESSLARIVKGIPKLTLGYIKMMDKLITSAKLEESHEFLLESAEKLKKRITAEREIVLRFEECETLCQLESIRDIEQYPMTKFPIWVEGHGQLEAWHVFQEGYVKAVEDARDSDVTPELLDTSEKTLVKLEDLLIEKMQIIEEMSIKKKKGKKKKAK